MGNNRPLKISKSTAEWSLRTERTKVKRRKWNWTWIPATVINIATDNFYVNHSIRIAFAFWFFFFIVWFHRLVNETKPNGRVLFAIILFNRLMCDFTTAQCLSMSMFVPIRGIRKTNFEKCFIRRKKDKEKGLTFTRHQANQINCYNQNHRNHKS